PLPRGLRQGPAERHRQRRDGHREDHGPQRAVVVHPRRRAGRHDRGRQGAPAPPGPRPGPGVPPAQRGRQGRGPHPGPRPQRPADAARPHRRRRVPRRRGPRHAPGHEHRPRRLAHDRPRQLPPGQPVPDRDHGPHGRHGAARAGHPGADGVGHRPHRPAHPPPGRQPADHPRQRSPGDGRRHHRPPGSVPVRLRHGRRRRRPVPGEPQEHRHPAEVRREAGRPRHPPRTRALCRGRVRPPGGGTAMTRLRLAVAALLALGVGLAATPAWADGVTVRRVDTTGFPRIRLDVLVDGPAPRTTDFHLRENGAAVPDSAVEVRPLQQTASPVGTVLVIDTSGSMRSRGALDQAEAAAHQFIASRAANEWTALVSVSSQAVVRSDFTQDGAALGAAVDALRADGETALWDGLSTAAHLYDRRPDLQPNVVLLSDGADSVSTGTEAQAVAALTGAHAAVFAVGIASAEFDPTRLAGLVGGSGGSFSTSADPADLSAQFSRIRAAIENQYELLYTSSGAGGALAVDLSVGSLTAEVQTQAGSPGVAAAPRPVPPAGGPFSGAAGRYLVLLLAAAAAGLGALALLLIFGRGRGSLEGRLGIYATPAAAAEVSDGSLV